MTQLERKVNLLNSIEMELLLYLSVQLNFFQLQNKKMLKKAKIVNISLNSPKNVTTPPIHLTRENETEHLKSFNETKTESILNDCIEAINIISTQRKLNTEKERKGTKVLADVLKEGKKTDKQTGIKLPPHIADSVEIILRKFIFTQVEEDQQKMKSSYSRQKKTQEKNIKLYKTLLFRTKKENTKQNENHKSVEIENEFFKSPPKIEKCNEKLLNKINALQTQIVFYKEKISQKNNLIAKLEARESFMKKKYHNEVSKMMRYKNILSINALFEKEYGQKEEGKYLMNVSGKNLQIKRELHSATPQSQKNRSSRVTIQQESKAKNGKLDKRTLKSSPTEAFLKKSNRKLEIFQNSQKTNMQRSLNSIENIPKKEHAKKQSQSKKYISKMEVLKQQLDQLHRQKQRTIQSLNENSNKLQRYIEDLDTKIMEKMKLISVQEELITDEELKMLKQEDFETLQLTGFYDGSDTLPNQNFQ